MKNTLAEANSIANYFSEFRIRIEVNNATGLFDVNRLSQGFCAEFLNVFNHHENLTLTDLDLERWNYPAIDVGDRTKKVAYQITSENDMQKIISTIEKFVRTDDFKKGIFKELRFLILKDTSWDRKQRAEIKKKFVSSGLVFKRDVQITSLKILQKQIKKLPSAKRTALKTLLENEFGVREGSPKAFDLSLFKEFDTIINENKLTNIYQGLYDGKPFDCAGLTDELINPYRDHSYKVIGQYFDSSLQTLHMGFIKFIEALREFLISHYTSGAHMEHLMVPEFYKGTQRLIERGRLVAELNSILDNTLSSYRAYRVKVRDLYFT